MKKNADPKSFESRRLVGEFLKKADKHLRAGEFERAGEEIAKALALDAENEYAFAYKERMQELEAQEVKKKRKAEEARDQSARTKADLDTGTATLGKDPEGEREDSAGEEKTRDALIASYLEQAEELLFQEQFDRARILVEKAFQLNPRDPRPPNLHTRINESKLSVQKRREKERARRDALGKKVQPHIGRITNYLSTGNLDETLEEIAKASSLDPENLDILRLSEKVKILEEERRRAKEDEGRRKREEAERNIEEEDRRRREQEELHRVQEEVAQQAKKEKIQKHFEQAHRHLADGKFQRALSEIERVYSLEPWNEKAKEFEETVQHAEFERRKAEVEARRRAEEEEHRRREEGRRYITEKRIQIHIERIKNYLGTGKFDKALDEIGEAYSLDPTNSEVSELAAAVDQAIEKRRETKKEEERLRKQEEQRKIEEEARQRREEEDRQRRMEEERRRAEEELRRRRQLEAIENHLENARLHLQGERFRRARKELKKVYSIESENHEVKQLEEEIWHTEENKRRSIEEERRQAKEEKRRLKEEHRRQKIEKKIQRILQNAQRCFAEGKLENALGEVQKALSLDPVNAQINEFIERIEGSIAAKRRADEEERKRAQAGRLRIKDKRRRMPGETSGVRGRKEDPLSGVVEESEKAAQLRKISDYLEKAVQEAAVLRSKKPYDPTARALQGILRNILEEVGQEVHTTKEPGVVVPDSPQQRSQGYIIEEEPERPIRVYEEAKKPRRQPRLAQKRKSRKSFVVASITLVFLAAGFVLLDREFAFFHRPKVLVVVPPKLIPGDPQENYLADALAATVIKDLSRVSDLIVFSEATSSGLRQLGNPMNAGRRLKASHVLHGTLQRAGPDIMLQVTLSETYSGKAIWTEELWTSLLDMGRLRKSLVEGVLRALNVKVGSIEGRFQEEMSQNFEALDLYWRGLARLSSHREEDIAMAVELFDQSLNKDSTFASPVAGKAAALLKLYNRQFRDEQRLVQQAKDLSLQALREDGNLRLASLALGSAYMYERNYARALEVLQKPLAVERRDAALGRALALVYSAKGEHETAADIATLALKLDPLNYESYMAFGLVKHMAGSFEEASSAYEQAFGLEPGIAWDLNGLLDNALLSQGSIRRALSVYEIYLRLRPDDYTMLYKVGRANQVEGRIQAAQKYFHQVIDLAQQEVRRKPKSANAYLYLALALTRVGKYQDAQEYGRRAVEVGSDDPAILYGMAGVYAMQKKAADALNWLRKAIALRYSYGGLFDFDLFNIRSNPEFAEIIHLSR